MSSSWNQFTCPNWVDCVAQYAITITMHSASKRHPNVSILPLSSMSMSSRVHRRVTRWLFPWALPFELYIYITRCCWPFRQHQCVKWEWNQTISANVPCHAEILIWKINKTEFILFQQREHCVWWWRQTTVEKNKTSVVFNIWGARLIMF